MVGVDQIRKLKCCIILTPKAEAPIMLNTFICLHLSVIVINLHILTHFNV